MIKLKLCCASKSKKNNYSHRNSHHYSENKSGLKRVLSEVEEIAENPPSTWNEHLEKPDGYWEVIQMEFIEAQKKRGMMKTGTGHHSDVITEYRHLAAALVLAVDKMTCDENQ